jgi:hypothetical protein
MGNSEKSPLTFQELVISSLAQTDALSKLLIEKGHHHGAGVLAEDFRGAGNVSADAQSCGAMTIYLTGTWSVVEEAARQ